MHGKLNFVMQQKCVHTSSDFFYGQSDALLTSGQDHQVSRQDHVANRIKWKTQRIIQKQAGPLLLTARDLQGVMLSI